MGEIKRLLYSWEKSRVRKKREKKNDTSAGSCAYGNMLLRNITRFSFSFSSANRDFNTRTVIICMPHAIPHEISWEAFALFYLPNSPRLFLPRLLLFHICLTGPIFFAADNAERFDRNDRRSLLCRRYTSVIYRLGIWKMLVARFSFLSKIKEIFINIFLCKIKYKLYIQSNKKNNYEP